MDRGQFHLLSCLRSRASGYSEDASDDEIVQLMKEAQAGDYFITSRLSGPFPRFQIFLSFQFADSGLYRTFIQNLRSNSPDLQTLPVEVHRDASSQEQSLVYSHRQLFANLPGGLHGRQPWQAEVVLEMKFTTPDGKTLFLRGPLVRWDQPKNNDCTIPWTFLWMATIPISDPISSTFGDVLGGQFTPVGWRTAFRQPQPGAQANLFPVPNHTWMAHECLRFPRSLKSMSSAQAAAELPGPEDAYELPLPKESCGEIFLHRVNIIIKLGSAPRFSFHT